MLLTSSIATSPTGRRSKGMPQTALYGPSREGDVEWFLEYQRLLAEWTVARLALEECDTPTSAPAPR